MPYVWEIMGQPKVNAPGTSLTIVSVNTVNTQHVKPKRYEISLVSRVPAKHNQTNKRIDHNTSMSYY